MKFQIYAERINKPGKTRCGDAFVTVDFEDESLLFLAVADGVSSTPCDWLASKIACDTAFNVFSRKPEISLLRKCAEEAHLAIRNYRNDCRGMLSSLSLAVFDKETSQLFYINVGDSAIFIGGNSNLEQITTDDTFRIMMTRNGKPILSNGVVLFTRGVTRSLGQPEPIDFRVRQQSIKENEMIVLATDGVPKDFRSIPKLGCLLGKEDWVKDLDEFVRDCAQNSNDDATLVVCRRR